MGKPQKEPLRELAETERRALQRMVHASSERVDRVRRARALLTVAAGGTFAAAAQEAGLRSGTAVANLVARFNRHGLAALSIASGRGRTPTYDAEARGQIVATAQAAPGRSRPSRSDCERMGWRRLGPTPSNGSWRMRAVPIRRPGVGVRRGPPSGYARA